GRLRQRLDLKLGGFGQVGGVRVVGLEQIQVFLPGAVGREHDLLAVRGPGDVVVVGGVVGQAGGFAAVGQRAQEQLAVGDEGDVLFVRGRGVLRCVAREGDDPLGVRLFVGVD